MVYLSIFFRIASLALGQSYDCPSASEVTLKDMGKIVEHLSRIEHNKALTMCVIFGMCIYQNIGVNCYFVSQYMIWHSQLLSIDTKILFINNETIHQWRNSIDIYLRQIHRRYLSLQSLQLDWKLLIQKLHSSLPGTSNFKCICVNKNIGILIQISLRFVPMVLSDNKSALVQVMAWHLTGDKSLSEPKLT